MMQKEKNNLSQNHRREDKDAYGNKENLDGWEIC
jgi:hypothetical protein